MAGSIQFQQALVLDGNVCLSGGCGEGTGLLRGGNGLGELAGFRAGGGKGCKRRGLLVLGQFTGVFGQLNGFGAGAEAGVGSGGKNPGKLVQCVGEVRLEPQRRAVMENGFL